LERPLAFFGTMSQCIVSVLLPHVPYERACSTPMKQNSISLRNARLMKKRRRDGQNIYTLYMADPRGSEVRKVGARWWQQEIACAQSVTNSSDSFRSDLPGGRTEIRLLPKLWPRRSTRNMDRFLSFSRVFGCRYCIPFRRSTLHGGGVGYSADMRSARTRLERLTSVAGLPEINRTIQLSGLSSAVGHPGRKSCPRPNLAFGWPTMQGHQARQSEV